MNRAPAYLLCPCLFLTITAGCGGGGGDAAKPSSAHESGVPQGAPWGQQSVFQPNPPRRPQTAVDFNTTVGTAQAATLAPDQPITEPALIMVDYMRLIEIDPIRGERVVDEQNYDNDGPRPLICIPNGPCEGGLYQRTPSWYVTDDHTAIAYSEIKGGVLTIDVSKSPNYIVHWWTSRVQNLPSARYFVEMRVKIVGKVGLQFGSDYWENLGIGFPPGKAFPEVNCREAICEAWASDWFGDTKGEFQIIRAPHQ